MSLRDYFSNNKIFTGTEKPTQGKFDVGDIIVNIGPNSAEEPMWICVEAGTPGVWELCSGVNEEEITNLIQSNALTAVEYTDGVDIQIDGGEIGNMNELQTTDKSSIVGAINELFQNANNGKELIANAIGEPLDASDTFSAMSTDINSLLSTFKTNMMNSGVVVESGDKFKQLIEKIKGLTEGEGNKGVQFASGTVSSPTGKKDFSRDNANGETEYVNASYGRITPGFKPQILLTYQEFKEIGYEEIQYIFTLYETMHDSHYNVFTRNIDTTYIVAGGSAAYHSSSVNNGEEFYDILMNDEEYYVNDIMYWYAIGVGEEDTTLRDSLASILTEEGVSVTEEDDMASLITKVDEEFEEKRLSLLEALTVKNIPINDNDSFDTLIGYISLFENYNLPSPNELSIYDSIEVIENAGGITFEKNTDHMLITIPQTSISYSLLIGTNTKYDLTDYANIVVEYYSSTGRFALGINDSSQDFTSCDHVESYIGESNYDTLTTYKLNISDYNNEYYILFNIDAASAYGGSLKLYQIYLEK